MKYISTRNKNLELTSSQAITKGLSDDGGLFCPENFPKITNDELIYLCNCDYIKKTEFVFSKFLSDYTQEEISNVSKKAYETNFERKEIAPIVKTEENTYILELFHGPTCAFKDMALQMLPHLMTTSLKKIGEKRTACILVATSGDTGKAALEGFCDVEQTKIKVFYPENGVSDVQKLQMITQKGENVDICAIKGNFDDAQSAVKTIFADKNIDKKLNEHSMFLSSANSINWGRLAPQIIYYISAYCDLVKTDEIKLGDPINVCVPTGNFGNILAAYIAKNMGINIKKLICASNDNNVLTEFLDTGKYDINREFHLTNSPSMDILISSNLERLLFISSNFDDNFVIEMMNSLKNDGNYQVNDKILDTIKSNFVGGYCTQSETNETIKSYYEKTNYLLDTHTAVAVKVHQDYVSKTSDNTKTVIASTASPFKFADSVLVALGEQKSNNGLENLQLLSDITNLDIPKSLNELKNQEIRFNKVIEKENIKDEAISLINL